MSTSQLGPYFLIEVDDPEGAEARPGQFHMLSSSDAWTSSEDGRPWLSRAISYLSSDQNGRFVFLIADVGPGTSALARLNVGDFVHLVGPLGNGFPDPREDLRPLLVGGGIGLAPILAYSDQLTAAAVEHDLVLGFRTGDHAAAVADRSNLTIATDDGSVGYHGTVLEPTVQAIEEGDREVFACGPAAMMEAIRSAAAKAEVPAWMALESPMACGFGACFGCAVETIHGTLRLCVDGPVLPAESLSKITATGRAD